MSRGNRKKQGKKVHVNDYAGQSKAPATPGDIKTPHIKDGSGSTDVVQLVQQYALMKGRGSYSGRRFGEEDTARQLDNYNRARRRANIPDLRTPVNHNNNNGHNLESATDGAPAGWGSGIYLYQRVKFQTDLNEGGLKYPEAIAILSQVEGTARATTRGLPEQHMKVYPNGDTQGYIVAINHGVVSLAYIEKDNATLGFGKTDSFQRIRHRMGDIRCWL
jgi:hypothetical protein